MNFQIFLFISGSLSIPVVVNPKCDIAECKFYFDLNGVCTYVTSLKYWYFININFNKNNIHEIDSHLFIYSFSIMFL